MATVRAPVNGALLALARTHHGISPVEAAHALDVRPEVLAAWEADEAQPTLNQLRKAAALYRRTPAFFFLTDAPGGDGQPAPTDFRNLSASDVGLGRPLAREVASARTRRHHIAQLRDTAPHALPVIPTVLESPEAAAGEVRRSLGVSVEEQLAFTSTSRALHTWIRTVENLGVLVFQMSGVTPTECRGFSVYEDVLPVTVLNGADSFGARQFTLFHELAHLISRTSAVCDLWHDSGVEARCNEFAANLLMPTGAVAHFLSTSGRATPDALGAAFSVSGSAAAVRLRTLGHISQASLDKYLDEATEAAIAHRTALKAKGKTGGPAPALLKVRNLGPQFVATVLNAMHDERISITEAAQILETKVQSLDKLAAEVDRLAVAS